MQPSHAPHLSLPSRSWVGRILILFGLLGVSFGAIWLAAHVYLTPERLRTLLVEHISSATGRSVTLEGDVKLHVGIEPRVDIGGIRLSNAPGMTDPLMISADRISVAVDALQLLMGRLVVVELALDAPEVFLEQRANGEANWDLNPGKTTKKEAAPPASAEAAKPAAPALFFERLTLNKAQIVLRRPDALAQTLLLDSLSVEAASSSDPLRLNLSGSFNNVPFSAGGICGPFNVIASGVGTFPFALQGLLGAAEWATTGDLQLSARRISSFNADMTATVSQLQNLSVLLDHPFADGLEGKISLKLAGNATRLTIDDAAADFRDNGILQLSGSIDGDWQNGRISAGSLKGQLEAGSLDALAVLLNLPLRSAGAVRLPFALNYTEKPYVLSADITAAQLGSNRFTARYNAARTGSTLSITDAALDASVYVPPPPMLDAATAATKTPAPLKKNGDALTQFWQERGALPASTTLQATQLLLPSKGGVAAFKNISVQLDNLPELVTLAFTLEPPGNGQIRGMLHGVPATGRKASTLTLALDAAVRDMEPLAALLTGTAALRSGGLTAQLELFAPATSLTQLQQEISGSAQLLSEDPRLNPEWLSASSGSLGDGAAQLLQSSTIDKAHCLALNFEGKNGLFNSRVAALDAKDIVIVGGGSINIAKQQLNMLFTPYGKTPQLAWLVGGVRLSGGFDALKTSVSLPGLSRLADGTLKLSGQGLGTLVSAAGSALGKHGKVVRAAPNIPENLCPQLIVTNPSGNRRVVDTAPALSFHKGGDSEASVPVTLDALVPKGRELLKKFLPQ